MQRAVTAIYRSPVVADLVREELEQIGVLSSAITVLPDAAGTVSGLSTAETQEDAIDRLHDLGLPETDARTYQQAIRNGDHVVSVEVDDGSHLSRVQEIMHRPEEAYDIDELDTRYAGADFISRRQGNSDVGALDQTGPGDLASDGTVKVVEERLAVGKREVEGGAVRVRSFVREVPVEAEVELRSTRVYIERRPVDRPVSPGEIGLPEQVLEAREHMEQPVVAKEARVVEEIALRSETEVQHQTIQDTVRKTEVEIEDERTGEHSSMTGGTSTASSGGTTGTGSSGAI